MLFLLENTEAFFLAVEVFFFFLICSFFGRLTFGDDDARCARGARSGVSNTSGAFC